MPNTYIWRLVPSSLPAVIRSCPKCGHNSEYECSRNFRVNANQSHIDVWLIYQCKKCKSTWNMEILSRVSVKSIEKELYQKFLNNDARLAEQYAFDLSIHSKNKSVPDYDGITYEIIEECGPLPFPGESFRLRILSDYPLNIRLDKLLGTGLPITRLEIKRLFQSGNITGISTKLSGSSRIKNEILLEYCRADYL